MLEKATVNNIEWFIEWDKNLRFGRIINKKQEYGFLYKTELHWVVSLLGKTSFVPTSVKTAVGAIKYLAGGNLVNVG